MYDEIDLRPYFQAIAKNWLWILLASILLGVVCVVFGLMQPDIYEANALLAVNRATPSVRLDDRIQEDQNGQDVIRLFPQIATSDEVLQSFIDETTDLPNGWQTVSGLRSRIMVESGTTNSLLVLTVSSEDPEEAMFVANAYARFFAAWLNQVYGDNNQVQNTFFAEQLTVANDQLAEAASALRTFGEENSITAVNNQLNSYSQTHATYLTTTQTLDLLLFDLQAFHTQLSNVTTNRPLTSVEETNLLALQLRAYNNQQLQITLNLNVDATETEVSIREAETLLVALIESVNGRLLQMSEKITQLETELRTLQVENIQLVVQKTQLETDYQIAMDAYTALSYQLNEQRLTEQDANDEILVLSRASLPSQPSGFGTILYLVVGLFLGGALSVSVIIIYTWWRVQVST